ncbi:hypothetical protein [Nocardia amamiensis]|uniref:hypothetical protein n=1 Tax=Nocardia amamiensis TaxID=404578 RepID=UPI0033D725D2
MSIVGQENTEPTSNRQEAPASTTEDLNTPSTPKTPRWRRWITRSTSPATRRGTMIFAIIGSLVGPTAEKIYEYVEPASNETSQVQVIELPAPTPTPPPRHL